MGVVAAGVHHAHLLAVPFGLGLAGERDVDFFSHWQAVHVGAQGHHRAGQPALEQPHHAGVGHAGLHIVEAQRTQMLGHDAGGAEFPVAQFGMGVEVTPPGGHAVQHRLGGGFDGGGQGAGGHGDVGVHRVSPRVVGQFLKSPAQITTQRAGSM